MIHRLKARFAKARMRFGCPELRRAAEEFTIFRPVEDPSPGPGFGSWL